MPGLLAGPRLPLQAEPPGRATLAEDFSAASAGGVVARRAIGLGTGLLLRDYAQMVETDAARLRMLADRARRLAQGVTNPVTRERLLAAAAEYAQRAVEVEMDNTTGQ